MLTFIKELNVKYWILILLCIIVIILIIVKFTFKSEMDSENFNSKRLIESFTNDSEVQDISELKTNNNTVIFVKFYAPWCGYCTKLQPTWKELYSEFDNKILNDKNIKIMKVNCDNHPKIAEHFNVSGYPTLILIKSNNVKMDCNSERTFNGLKNFLITNS